jgi:hypothetical protein
MTRTDALKAIYLLRVGAIVLVGVTGGTATRNGHFALAVGLGVLLLVLLFSGQVQARFWSELLAGLHWLGQRDYALSKAYSERFLGQLRERPWLRHLMWLGTSSYSLRVEALALNNLGAAEIGLGEMEAARAHLTEGLALDPKCPLFYRNMGVLALRTGSDAEPWLQKAVALGLNRGWSDRWVRASQRRNAALSTTGSTDEAPLGPQ